MEHRSYGLDDGLDNVYLDPQQCANLPDGSILTHGGTGIMIFNPDSVWQSGDASETEIVIHKVRISGKDLITDKDPNQISRIELNPRQKYLEIYYRALIFPRANDITYSYKIEGLSDEWIFHNKNESVTLAGLSPGIIPLW